MAGDQGEALERFTVRHAAAGLRQLAALLAGSPAGLLRELAVELGVEV